MPLSCAIDCLNGNKIVPNWFKCFCNVLYIFCLDKIESHYPLMPWPLRIRLCISRVCIRSNCQVVWIDCGTVMEHWMYAARTLLESRRARSRRGCTSTSRTRIRPRARRSCWPSSPRWRWPKSRRGSPTRGVDWRRRTRCNGHHATGQTTTTTTRTKTRRRTATKRRTLMSHVAVEPTSMTVTTSTSEEAPISVSRLQQ